MRVHTEKVVFEKMKDAIPYERERSINFGFIDKGQEYQRYGYGKGEIITWP